MMECQLVEVSRTVKNIALKSDKHIYECKKLNHPIDIQNNRKIVKVDSLV